MITKSDFGKVESRKVSLYRLENGNGMNVSIIDYGATVTSIVLPINGRQLEVACGFQRLEGYFSNEYKANSPYFGCTVGRYSSQIKDARFFLNGIEFELNKNAGDNNLHGGINGFDKRVWDSRIVDDTLEMSLVSRHLEEGFPGNVSVKVVFRLTEANELVVSYDATTDQTTPLSLTNHTYFNLSGFLDTVENHHVTVHAYERLKLDGSGAATGEVINLDGMPDDLRYGKRIADVHGVIGDGFEHFYIFDNKDSQLNRVAEIRTEAGISLEVLTTEPCMLLYTGKYTSDSLKREDGLQYGKFRGFCCETHRYPNGPNIPGSPGSITRPDERFKSETRFKFNINR